MSLLIISVQDLEDGTVSVRMVNEPPVTKGQTTFTQAERMGAVALNAIKGALEQDENRIVLVGADAMPH